VDKGKLSKIKNVYGESSKLYFEDVKPVESSTDGQLVDVNTHFAAISWSSTGGGSVAVLDALNPIRIPNNTPLIRGHNAHVVDVKWSPFKTNILATASDDATVKIWDIPQEGLKEDLKTPIQTLTGHLKKVGITRWHPSVFEIIATAGYDNKLNLWNVLSGESLHSFTLADNPMSLEWNSIGALLALTTKDKNTNIIDPRANKTDVNFKAYESSKNSKACWVDDEHVVVVGYGKSNDRQIKLFDLKNTSKEVQTVSIDTQSGPIQPFFDEDTGLLLVPGRGEGNIKYYEYSAGSVKVVGEYKSGTSQKSVCFFPKRTMNYNKCEIARIGKLTSTTLEYVSFYIPKRVEGFVAEVYPDCLTGETEVTLDAWKSGSTAGASRKAINTLENKWKTAEVAFETKVVEEKKTEDVGSLKERVAQLEKLLDESNHENEALRQKITELEEQLSKLGNN